MKKYISMIECFWTISSEGKPAPSNAGTILPDGGVELVLNFGDAVKRQHVDDSASNELHRLVVGQMPRWTSVEYAGKADPPGIRFHPAGACAFLRLPDWNWHAFSTIYTAVSVAAAFIGWFLAGLAIASVVRH